jgi:hypothetical protein
MPSVSQKQHNFFAAIAHSPEFAKKAGVSQSVGKDFYNADKATHKFASGGPTSPNSFKAYAQQNLPVYSQMAAMQARSQEQEAQFKQALAQHYAQHPEDAPQQPAPPSPQQGQMQQMQQMQQLGTPNAAQAQSMRMNPMNAGMPMAEGGVVAGDTELRLPVGHVMGGMGQKHIRTGAMFHPHFGPRVRKFADGGSTTDKELPLDFKHYPVAAALRALLPKLAPSTPAPTVATPWSSSQDNPSFAWQLSSSPQPTTQKFADGGDVDRMLPIQPTMTDAQGNPFDPSKLNQSPWVAELARQLSQANLGVAGTRQLIPSTSYTKNEMAGTNQATKLQNQLDVARGMDEFGMRRAFKPAQLGGAKPKTLPYYPQMDKAAPDDFTPPPAQKYMRKGGLSC